MLPVALRVTASTCSICSATARTWGDYADHAPTRGDGSECLNGCVEVVAVERAKTLVKEERFEPPAATGHHFDHAERERQGRDELFATGEASGRARLAGIRIQHEPFFLHLPRVDERVLATAHLTKHA